METTKKQAALLKRLNLPIPAKRYVASSLLDFALCGNGSCNQDAKKRRASIRKYWNDWVGKLVRISQFGHRFQGACGRIEYLRARTKEEIREVIETCLVRNPIPFVAVVRLDPVEVKISVEINLTGLKRIKERQKRLFLS